MFGLWNSWLLAKALRPESTYAKAGAWHFEPCRDFAVRMLPKGPVRKRSFPAEPAIPYSLTGLRFRSSVC